MERLFQCYDIDAQQSEMSSAPSLKEDEDTECLQQIRNLLSPGYIKELLQVYMNSGKGINQLGNQYQCETKDNKLEHITLQIIEANSGFTVLSIGLCSPKHCNTPESFSTLTAFIDKQFRAADSNSTLEARMINPKLFNTDLNAGAIIMILIIAFLVFLWIAGIIVAYTKIGDKFCESREETKIHERKSKWALALYSFNPFSNLNKIVSVDTEGDKTLWVLNGVRVFSMAWVIIGHSFSSIITTSVSNLQSLGQLFDTFHFGIIGGGMFAVDSFFWLSGFLTFYIITSKMYAKKELKSIGGFIMLYVHRFLRLIFPLAFVQFFMMFLMRYFGSGPLYWQAWNFSNKSCNTYWWSNLVFINNFVPWNIMDSCMSWTWYLANDFQFFAVSPFIIMAYCYNRKIAYIICFILVLISMGLSGVITAIHNVNPMTQARDYDAFSLMYTKPWTRMGPYFLGAVFGFSYFELTMREVYIDLGYTTFNKLYSYLRDSRATSLALAFIGVAITAIFCFPLGSYFNECGNMFDTSLPSNCWGYFPSVLFNTLSRVSFVFGLSLLLLPTFVNRLRIIRGLLCNELFVVLARLSYIAYLLHPIVIFWNYFDAKQGVYASTHDLWFFGIGSVIVTYLLTIPFTLLCEAPFMNLEKYLLMPFKKKQQATKDSFNYVGESQLILNETADGDEEEPTLVLKKFD
ncbi:unnamed protein product [Moneuplotes crassus]|uniref:Acyltransferase 3 domain-containing protein n=1 Tax=Euplotes crassus TaxID=5936 RepID=A0AAD1YA42_EUPCR|nr:unnamed protein product [Moneuplotes crassus]